MVKEYKIVAIKDDTTTATFSNIVTTGLLRASNIRHTKRDKIALFDFTLDNGDGTYSGEFSDFNDIEFHVKIDNITFSQRFGGEVYEVVPNSDNTKIVIRCRGRNAVLKERYYTGVASTIDLGQHIKNVIDEKASEIDSTGISTSTGEIIDEIKADSILVFDHFEDLLKENTYQLDISPTDVANLFNENKGASGLTLNDGTGGNVLKGDNNLVDSSLGVKNSITVIGGSETLSKTEDSVTWNIGDNTLIPLSNAVDSNLVVKFDSVIQTLDTDYELTSDNKFIKLLTISNGEVIDSTYDYKSSVWWKETDLGSGSKVREFVIKDPTILTQTRAESLAKNTLAKLSLKQVKGDIGTTLIDIEFEWYQTLILNTSRFTGTHIIVGFIEIIKDDYKVIFQLAQVLDENTKKILELLKDVDKLKGADIASSVLKDGFNVSDFYDITDLIEGWEQGVGDRWIFNHPTNSKMNDGKVMRTGADYSTTATQFL